MRAAAVDSRWQPVVNLAHGPRPGAAGWVSGDMDEDKPFFGAPSLTRDDGSCWAGISPVEEGKRYTVTAWFWTEATGLSFRANFYLQASGMPSRTNNGPFIPLIPGQWTPVSVTAEVPEGYDRTRPHFYWTGNTQRWWIGGIMIEPRPRSSGGYIAGDLPGARWLGTPHNSPSVGYPHH